MSPVEGPSGIGLAYRDDCRDHKDQHCCDDEPRSAQWGLVHVEKLPGEIEQSVHGDGKIDIELPSCIEPGVEGPAACEHEQFDELS